MGNINMPLSAAYVHGILSSAKSSFKLASPMGRVGVATSDRQFAVAGELDKKAATVPISLFLSEPERNFTRRYSVELVADSGTDSRGAHTITVLLVGGAGQMGDLQLDQGTFTTRMILSTDKYGDIERQPGLCADGLALANPAGGFLLLPRCADDESV